PDVWFGRPAALAGHERGPGGPAAVPRPAAATVPAASCVVCARPGRPRAGGGDGRGGAQQGPGPGNGCGAAGAWGPPAGGGGAGAVGGDGRWAASSGWSSDRVRLWDVGTGRMVNEWVLGRRTFVFFTPDSRALIIAQGGEYSFWDVATLQPIRRLRREVAH